MNKSNIRLKAMLTTNGINFVKKGQNSYAFEKLDKEKVFDCIKRTFGINNEKFDIYFDEACGGSGNEEKKLDSIWSSALLSLLFFYSTVTGGGLKLPELPGDLFTECFFEFKTPTFEKNPSANSAVPSNIDCVLLNKEHTKIVFIESKFSEYVASYREKPIGKEILSKRYYDDIFTKNISPYFTQLVTDNKYHYFYGIKQMITHYSGIQNFIRGINHNSTIGDKRKMVVIDVFEKGADVYLLEVIYDLSSIGYTTEKNDYIEIEKEFCTRVNNEGKIIVLPLITYQELFKYSDNAGKINNIIADYYKLNSN